MQRSTRRRALIATGIVLGVAVMAVIVATQPGSSLCTRWELARIRRVEKPSIVFLEPGATLGGDAETGWTVPVLRPVEPVWRYQELNLRLLPGCETVLPFGRRGIVAGSTDSTAATAFMEAATAAMTVRAAEVDRGRELACRQVVVGTPSYATIESDLRRGAKSSTARVDSRTSVAGRATFERHGRDEFIVLGIPERQSERSFSTSERQYAVLQPETLFIAQDESGVRTITLEEAKRLVRRSPSELVQADLEQRGFGVFVVQLRVRAQSAQ